MGPILTALMLVPTPGRVLTLGRMGEALRSPGGAECFIAPELRDEAIYVRGVEDPARLRTLVARAASAEWVELRGGLRLERSPAMRKRLAQAERATLAADLEAALDSSEAPPPLDAEAFRRFWNVGHPRSSGDALPEGANETRYRALGAIDANQRAVARFCTLADPDRLAAALEGTSEPGYVRLFGRGGGRYRALPLDGAAFLAAERADRTLIATTPVEGGPDAPDPAAEALPPPLAARLANGELGVLLWRTLGRVAVSLYAVAPDGTAAWLGSGAIEPPAPRPETFAWPRGASARTISPAMVRKEPVVRGWAAGDLEPLDPLARPVLDALAEGETRPVVIDLPDETSSLARGETRTVGDATGELRPYVSIESVDGAIVGRPRFPRRASALRFPRAELAAWWTAVRNPTLSLDEAAALAGRIGLDPAATWIELQMLVAANGGDIPTANPIFVRSTGRADLMLWRSLSPAVRATLARGGTVDLGWLPSETAHWAEIAMVTQDAVTAFLARNGPPRLTLMGAIERTPVAISAPPVEPEIAYDAGALARGLRAEPGSRFDLRGVRFGLGERRDWGLSVRYAPAPADPVAIGLTEIVRLPGAPVGWERLPSEILDPLRKALADDE